MHWNIALSTFSETEPDRHSDSYFAGPREDLVKHIKSVINEIFEYFKHVNVVNASASTEPDLTLYFSKTRKKWESENDA